MMSASTAPHASAAQRRFDTLFDCFVINLKRQPERLHAFLAQTNPSGIDFNRFEAVDGETIDLAEVEGRIIVKGPAPPTRGMIGNAMSHLALLRRCAGQTKNFLVLEDDAVVRHDIKTQFGSLAEQMEGWDIILLGYNTNVPLELTVSPGIDFGGLFSARYPTPQQLSDFAFSTNPVALHRLVIAMGSCGYAVTPKGAQILIDNCFPMDNRPVSFRSTRAVWPAASLDAMMATAYCKMQAFACFAPLVMTPNDQATSTTAPEQRKP